MQRSTLWDDFIIREMTDYRNHVCRFQADRDMPESYEEYFQKNITEPQFKKRNLTPRNLNLVLAERETDGVVKTSAMSMGINEKCSIPCSHCSRSSDVQVSPTKGHWKPTTCPSLKIRHGEIKDTAIQNLTVADKSRDWSRIGTAEGSSEWLYESYETASVELGDADADAGESIPPSGAQQRSISGVGEVDMGVEHELMRRDKEGSLDNTTETDLTGRNDDLRDAIDIGLEVPDRIIEEIRASSAPLIDQEDEFDDVDILSRETNSCGGIGRKDSDGDQNFETASTASRCPIYPPSKPRGRTRHISESNSNLGPSPPWWHHPNTPFKSFARAYVSLRSELGRCHYKIDERGVIIPRSWHTWGDEGRTEGGMERMGWTF
jgi:hypothetical protein